MCGRAIAGLIVTMALATGCGAPDPLPAKSALVPAGIDLSGQWELQAASLDSNRRIEEVERRASGAAESLIPPTGKSSSNRDRDEIQVHVFLEKGESLKLTQTEHGLFVSFDRAIVEEYRFGEQRTASIGGITADRVSGWEDGAYVIETRGKEGAMLIESYRLDGPDTMVRTVRITDNDENRLDIRQVFDRR